MRVAFVSTISDYPWGGADFMWTRAAEICIERGDSLLVAVSPVIARYERVTALKSRGAILHLREPRPIPTTFSDRLTRALKRFVNAEDPTVVALAQFRPELVVFSCGGTYDLAYFPAWTQWLLGTRTRFRVICNWQSERPTLEPAEKDLITRVFSAAERLCFVSTRNLEVTRAHLQKPLENAFVAHNPLRWKPSDATPWPPSPPLHLASVSRLEPSKGIDLFLRAAAQVLPKNESWTLNIHGTGPAEQDLRSLSQSLGLEERVFFRGYVGDLRTIWENNHLMVSPSVEDGVPMTIPEALLCSRPVLATSVGGTRDWVRDGVSGFISRATDVDALSATLLRAWEQRSRWQEMGRAGASETSVTYRPDDYLQVVKHD